MTAQAVHGLIGEAVVSDRFKERLMGRELKDEDLKSRLGMEDQDITAIKLALLQTADFSIFSGLLDAYLKRQYPKPEASSFELGDVLV